MSIVRDELRESKRTAAEEQVARERLEAKLKRVTERYDEKFKELENQIRENKRLMDRVTDLQQRLDLERSYREQHRADFQRQLQQDREQCHNYNFSNKAQIFNISTDNKLCRIEHFLSDVCNTSKG